MPQKKETYAGLDGVVQLPLPGDGADVLVGLDLPPLVGLQGVVEQSRGADAGHLENAGDAVRHQAQEFAAGVAENAGSVALGDQGQRAVVFVAVVWGMGARRVSESKWRKSEWRMSGPRIKGGRKVDEGWDGKETRGRSWREPRSSGNRSQSFSGVSENELVFVQSGRSDGSRPQP